MDTKLLEEIGLTEGEVKVYLTLLGSGTSKTGPLAVNAGVSSSKVYKILSRLEKKGLVVHVLKGEIKFFSALEPNRILDYLTEKQTDLDFKRKEIEKIIPELQKLQKLADLKSEASIYEGYKSVTNFFRNILDELGPGDIYYVIGAGYGDMVPDLHQFFFTHHKRRAFRKIKVKMLANYDTKEDLVETARLYSEVRFLPQYLITNTEIVFYNNKVFIAIFTKEPKGFMIESEEAVKSFHKYFNALWRIAKP